MRCSVAARSCDEVDTVVHVSLLRNGFHRGRLVVVKRDASGELVRSRYYLVAPDYSSCDAYLGVSEAEAKKNLPKVNPAFAQACPGWAKSRPGIL